MEQLVNQLFAAVYAGLSRKWKGGGGAPKWAWLTYTTSAALVFSGSLWFALAWLYIMLAYTVPPTHVLFSAGHNQPPGREDSLWWQWMRPLTSFLTNKLVATDHPQYWQVYGLVYGSIRSSLTLPGFIALAMLTSSAVPLYFAFGMLFVSYAYKYACEGLPSNFVMLAEIIIGWYMGVIMTQMAMLRTLTIW